MAYCWKCGKPLPEGAKFCIYCGAEVRIVQSEPEEAPERIIEEKPVDTRGLYYNPKPVEDNS